MRAGFERPGFALAGVAAADDEFLLLVTEIFLAQVAEKNVVSVSEKCEEKAAKLFFWMALFEFANCASQGRSSSQWMHRSLARFDGSLQSTQKPGTSLQPSVFIAKRKCSAAIL